MVNNVLVVGNGGREHALAWKLRQSPHIGKLYVAPGNGGTREIAENIPIEPTDIKRLLRFTEENLIDLTVVGPDNPLALGIVDVFQRYGSRIFGPRRGAARIETSKAFFKRLARDWSIPTAPFQIFRKYSQALSYIRQHGAPIVIKASGLAFGKGAYVCRTLAEAETVLTEIMIKRIHGTAGNEVIAEDFLDGPEISIHALCDSKTSILWPPAQDHKPVFNGNHGKNTGGMGTIVPVPWFTNQAMADVNQQIVQPVLQALAEKGHPFTGCLYPGLKITADEPELLEVNARFGDPETQSYMRLLKTDLFDILEACVEDRLDGFTIEWHPGFAVCVVLASGEYPDHYEKGIPISGLSEAEKVSNVVVFHAGTTYSDQLRTAGGRVLGVTATGKTLQEALNQAYEAIGYIKFQDMHYRTDIGAQSSAMRA